jgi:hypothetical protein
VSGPPIADEVLCTCPPTSRRLPHRKTCARYRYSSSRAKSVQDRAKGADRGEAQ